ncbi:MAG TPA: hypothetical protein VH762_15890 [Gemmatimonadaceae bacterium]|jgi:hypothetical protein
MKHFTRYVLAIGLLSSTACFRQVVQTGNTAGSNVVDRQFVATWLWGIVPAQPIDVRQSCPSGVATIETEQSFMNGLVGLITLGIYSPQHLRVTCATGSARLPEDAREIIIPANVSKDELSSIVSMAVQQTLQSGTATVVRF